MQYPGKNCIIRAQITIGQEKQTLLLKQIFFLSDSGTMEQPGSSVHYLMAINKLANKQNCTFPFQVGAGPLNQSDRKSVV